MLAHRRAHWSDRSKAGHIRRLPPEIEARGRSLGTIQRVKDRQGLYRAAENVMTNLAYFGPLNVGLIVSRDNNQCRFTAKILDTLHALGWITQAIAPRRSTGGTATVINATEAGLHAIGHLQAPEIAAERRTLIELRDSKGKPLPVPARLSRALTPSIRKVNRVLAKSTVSLHGIDYPSPQYYRIFNGDMQSGGRWYHCLQTMPKADRAHLEIDNAPTIELDFAALHPRLLYAEAGIQFDGDPYQVPGVDRDVVKLLFMTLLYDRDVDAARRHLKSRQHPRLVEAYHAHLSALEEWNGTGEPPRRPACLWEGFTPLDASLDIDDAIDALLSAHKPIAHLFDQPGKALAVQYRDARLAEAILVDHANIHRPCLGLHDSFIVQAKHAPDLAGIMAHWYREITGGFECPIR